MTIVPSKNKQGAVHAHAHASTSSASTSIPSGVVAIEDSHSIAISEYNDVDYSISTADDVTHHTAFEDEHEFDMEHHNDHLLPPMQQESAPTYTSKYEHPYARPQISHKSSDSPHSPHLQSQDKYTLHHHQLQQQSLSMKSMKSQKSERTVSAVMSAVQLALSKGDTVVTVDMNDNDNNHSNDNDIANHMTVQALQDEMDATDHHLTADSTEYVFIHDDVYNMFFLSHSCGQAFFYAAYVFSLKIALYTFLALDVIDDGIWKEDAKVAVSPKVLAAQCLMLPVAVAMQEDLIATYYLLANIKYCHTVRLKSPDARKWKYNVANIARGIDGFYSLLVNFVVLLKADSILPMFLNFAALMFLQTIDNIALQLAASGFLTERLECVALAVKDCRLPKKHNVYYKALDSVFFISTVFLLFIAWSVIYFYDTEPVAVIAT